MIRITKCFVPKCTPLRRQTLFTTRCQKGYIVLVPEFGEDSHLSNSLIQPNGLPDFNYITIENCLAAIGQQAGDIENLVKEIENDISSKRNINMIKDVFIRIDKLTSPLETTWGIAKTLYLGNNSLIPTKSYLSIHERASRARASKFSSLTIYNAIVNNCTNSSTEKDLENNRLVQKYLLEGKLNGITLPVDEKQQLNEILNKLSKERTIFKNKVETAIQQFSHTITKYSLVRDFPPCLLKAISTDTNQPMEGPWKITLRPHIVKGFLEHCPDRNERWNIWQADVRKASVLAQNNLENSAHIENIRSLRKMQAQILGFPDFVSMSMETKMLKSEKNIKDIFNSLLKHAYPAQIKEIKKLREFSIKSGNQYELKQCDIAYWKRKQLKAEFGFDEQLCKEFFPICKVITGLFYQTEQLFQIKIVENTKVHAWHSGVKYFDIYDESNSEAPIAGFYLDCFSKENDFRETTGSMVGIKNRDAKTNTKPLAALIFNFNKLLYGQMCLLSIKDVKMIFKTFGIALQHLLTRAINSDLAGLSNIEWDASEVCGFVLSNLLNDDKVLKSISGHYNTHELLSENDLRGIKSYMTHMSGYELCKELYISHLDLELHSSTRFWLDIVKEIWPIYMSLSLDKKDSHPCSMTEIFSGNWGAAYFSHINSKLIAADIFSAFVEEDLEQTKGPAGKRFRNTFLTYGGSVSTEEVFRRFRGRDPSPQAIIKSLGLYQSN